MIELLAKSGPGAPTLLKHTQDVVDAAEALLGNKEERTRLGGRWLSFFKLDPSADWERFRVNLLAACLTHDWGKANDGFQAAVRGRRDAQAIRHEHLSALLIGLPAVAKWLGTNKLIDVPLVLSAVLTHHLKASGRADGWARSENGRSVFNLEPGLTAIMVEAGRRLGLPVPPPALPTRWTIGKGPEDVRPHRDRIQREVLEPLRRNHQSGPLLLAVRAALIASDAAGSGVTRVGEPSVADWVKQNLTRQPPLTDEDVNRDVIRPRIEELKGPGKWKDLGDGRDGWTDFQRDCDRLPDRALLLAPCGSGKTLAAWRWIAARLRDRPAGHVLFLYPTRATAREGFKDYVSWAPEADAKLMHGTSGFDLADMFANPPDGDERAGRTYRVERALYSLGYWRGRVFSATVDQFLAFMQYGYGPLCMLPVLADSVVVVDEVHSFDRNMFSALKDFLREFNVPVLCMTATLMNDRRDDLIACGLRPPADWPDDLQKLADLPRYTLRRVPARAAAEAAVKTALARGKRVLWVVNQVKRAHQIVRDLVPDFDPGSDTTELRTEVGGKAVPVFCYHSRFKLADRVKRHSDVMRALKDEPGPALGVTTQVCEMSLDIDVDLLVTEECPVTALVQRMGRCNRDSKNPRPLAETGEVLVYPPEDGTAPYSDNDLKGLDEFLRTLDGRECSQALLEHTLVNLKTLPEPAGDVLSRFLASGPYAVAPKDDEEAADGGFREDNDFNRPCVLPEEVAAYNAALREARPGFVVPVPRRYGHGRDDADPGHQELPGYLGVAAGGRYHPAVGYWDQTRDDWTEGGR